MCVSFLICLISTIIMEKKHLHKLISNFFEKDFPKDIRSRFATWFIQEKQTGKIDEALEEIWDSLPTDIDSTSLSELKKVNERIQNKSVKLYRRLTAVAAAVMLPLLGAVGTIWYYNNQKALSDNIAMVEHFVPSGERKQLALPDGSTVWLDAGSILIYPEKFGKTRNFYLSGKGNFNVAKDEEKPFIVKTTHLTIEALGTIFNVHSYPNENNTTVTLESGKVQVDDKLETSSSIVLTPNEQLVFTHSNASFKKNIVDAARVSSWTQGYLVFQQETLSNIFHSLERKYNVKINYNDSKFAYMTFTVRFHADDTLEDALDILKRIGVNFKYKITNKDVYIE